MTNNEIAKLIQSRYKLVNEPKENEVIQILEEINKYTTEEKFEEIIFNNISDRLSYCNESADMSDTINILELIQDELNSQS